ncbi:MAG: helix-turn-helix domain-containing protein [Thermoleophilia bacterium]
MATITEGRGLSSIGGSLREARIAAGYGLDQVSAALGIRSSYLEALEGGGLDRILGPAYVESIIVRYAMFAGLDPERFLLSVARGVTDPPNGNGKASTAQVTPRAARRVASPPGSRTEHRPHVRRIALVTVLLLALVAVGVFGGLQLDLFSLLGGDSSAGERSATSAVAAASDSGAVGEGAAATGDSTPPTTVTPDTGDIGSGDSGTADIVPGDGTSAVLAATTTLRTEHAGPSIGGPQNVAEAGLSAASPGARGFALEISASDEAWVEVRDAESGTALHVGAIAKGASISLDADGPVDVVAGRPEVLSVTIDARTVETPNAFRWVVTASGVNARS